MGAKFKFPVAVSPYRIPEPALGIAKLGAAYVSKPHGKINVGVLLRISHLNAQITSAKLKILFSRNALHR